MNVFDLDAHVIGTYESFSRSFTKFLATDIAHQVNAIYEKGTFWPEPLLGINPRYLNGPKITQLAESGVVDPAFPSIFAKGAFAAG